MTFEYKKNNLFVVCSGTKGIGKTWFSCVLCQSLARLKQKVLFFDADGGIENISFQLHMDKSDLYAQMLKHRLTLNNAVRFCAKGRFDVICAEPAKNNLSTYPVGLCQILVSDLKSFALNYDQVVVDCSAGNRILKNIFLQSADNIILLVAPSLNGSVEAYKELEQIKKISPNAQISVVINRAHSYSEGEQIFKTIFKADKQYLCTFPKFLGVIKQDGRIRDCIANKTTLFERYPVCENLHDILNFSKQIIKGD